MRRLRNILFLATLPALICTSCEKGTHMETANVSIGFSNNVATFTRAEDINNNNLTSMGVFAYFTHGNFDEATSTPNFMHNQLVEKKSGTWQYTPVKYWPNNNTDKISFFAYAPHNATGVTQSNATDKGYPILTYTVPQAEASQIDLLASVPIIDQNKGNVNFKMQHVLTKVVFYVKSNDDTTGKKVTTFSVKGAKGGMLTYHAPINNDDKGFEWSYPSSVIVETFTATATALSVPDKSTAKEAVLSTYFLLPKDVGNTFNITYTYTGTNGLETITLNNQPLPSLDKWLPGVFVSYTIGIDKRVGATVTTDIHPTWGDGGKDSVDGTIGNTK